MNALFFNDESSLSQAYSQRSEEGDSSDQLTASSENIPQPPENSTAEIDAVASLKGFEIKSDSATGSVEYTKGLVKVNYQATNDAGISDGAYAIFVDGKRVYDGYMGIKRNGFSEPEYVFNKALDLLNQSTGTELSEIDLETSDNAPETLITAPNGSDDFGEITPEQADLMGGSAGKIKLQLGFHDDKTGRGFGKIHIDRDIRAEQLKANGYDSTEDLIFDVAQNKNAIFQGKGNTFILAKNNGKAKIAFVQVKQGDGGVFYSVGSGLISRADYLKNKALLWERAQSNQIDNNPPSAVTGEKQSSDENIPQPPQNTITEIDTEIESLKSETDRKVFDKRLDDLAAMIEERDLMEQYDPQLNELADILTEILKKAAAGVM